jgi:HAD superfamily hydrolase (TIGR01509 family)
MPSFPPNAGIIFDMDGLMVDSERIAKIAWQQAARLSGHDLSDALFASMIGRTKFDSVGLLRDAFGPGFNFDRAYDECSLIYQDYITRYGLPLKPGIRELLDDLSARGIPLGVATSTRNPTASQRLEQVGLLRYFSVVVGGNEITHGKPAPDIYLEAVRRLNLNASVSFALEDSFPGVRSAHGAGLQVIMVPDLVAPTPEIAALTVLVAPSLHEARDFFATVPRYSSSSSRE